MLADQCMRRAVTSTVELRELGHTSQTVAVLSTVPAALGILRRRTVTASQRNRRFILFRLLALLLPLLLCACDAGTARQPSEIESPLQNNCQPADGHSKTTPTCWEGGPATDGVI
jgi:hypothetical protein